MESKLAFQLRLKGALGDVTICKIAESEDHAVEWARAQGHVFASHVLVRKFRTRPASEFSERFLAGAQPKVLSTHDPRDLGVLMGAKRSHVWTVINGDPDRLLIPDFLFNASAEFVVATVERSEDASAVFEL